MLLNFFFTCVKLTYVHLPSFPHLTYEGGKAQEDGDHYIGHYYYILPVIYSRYHLFCRH
jgi:hypothetical protein